MSLVMQCDVCKTTAAVTGWAASNAGGLPTEVDLPDQRWVGGNYPFDLHLCPDCQADLADFRASREDLPT